MQFSVAPRTKIYQIWCAAPRVGTERVEKWRDPLTAAGLSYQDPQEQWHLILDPIEGLLIFSLGNLAEVA